MRLRQNLIKLIISKKIWDYESIKHKKTNELFEIINKWYKQKKINLLIFKFIDKLKIKIKEKIKEKINQQPDQNIELIKLIVELKKENFILKQTINDLEFRNKNYKNIISNKNNEYNEKINELNIEKNNEINYNNNKKNKEGNQIKKHNKKIFQNYERKKWMKILKMLVLIMKNWNN